MEFQKVLKQIYGAMEGDILSINFDFNGHSMLIEITENELPIIIHKVKVFDMETGISTEKVAAEVYSELLRRNLTTWDVYILNKVIEIIDKNIELFEAYIA